MSWQQFLETAVPTACSSGLAVEDCNVFFISVSIFATALAHVIFFEASVKKAPPSTLVTRARSLLLGGHREVPRG